MPGGAGSYHKKPETGVPFEPYWNFLSHQAFVCVEWRPSQQTLVQTVTGLNLVELIFHFQLKFGRCAASKVRPSPFGR